MRLAAGILALILMVFLGIQSLLIYAGTGITGQAKLSEAAAMGLLGSFLFLLGGAFAFKLPTVSAVIFGLAALVLISGASTASYSDLSIWAGVAAILCLLAIGGRVEARRKARRLAGQYVPQQYVPQQYVPQQYAPQQYAPQQPQQYAPTPQSHVQLGE